MFIHGWICDHSYFAPQADFFSRWHRVVSVDLRGHGESDRPDGRYTIEALADDVAWVHGELGIERSLVVGHSMGALIALAMAGAHPGLVAKAVLGRVLQGDHRFRWCDRATGPRDPGTGRQRGLTDQRPGSIIFSLSDSDPR